MDGYIFSWGENSAKNLSRKITELSAKHNDITININSGGGSVFEGIAIVNAMNDSDAVITTNVTGIAASMAFVIAVAGDKAKMSKYAKLMAHKPSGGAAGQSDKLREAADLIDDAEDSLVKIISDKRGISEDVVRDKYFQSEKDVWLNAEKALSAGLIDESYSISNSTDKLPENFDKFSIAAQMQHYSGITSQNDDDDTDPDFEIQNIKPKTPKTIIDMDIKIIAVALGLDASTAEGEVVNALHALKAKNDSLEAKLKQKENDDKAATTATLKKSVTDAVAEGKITASQESVYMSMAENDAEGLTDALSKLKGKKPLNLDSNVPDSVKGKTWNEVKPEDRLKLKEDNLEAYKALWEAEYGGTYQD